MKIAIQIDLGNGKATSYQDVLNALVCTAGSLSSAEEPLALGQTAFVFNHNAEDVGFFTVLPGWVDEI
jgi:hypothetical protein